MLRPVAATRYLSILLIPVLAACASQDPAAPVPTPLRDQRLHALMIGELDQQLARLDALAFDLHLTPTELDAVRTRRGRAIALNAARLRGSAAEVIGMQASLPLAVDDASRFAALARQLQTTAASLERLADAGRLQEIPSVVRELRATCSECHSLYRGR